jgi:hypothetical protein
MVVAPERTYREAVKTACLFGAGAAGLAAGKALADRGIDFDWFEKGSYVGGLWQIDNDNGGAAAYESLHLNSSRPRTQYPSFPMPQDWPDYPRYDLVARYFEDFADRFGLRDRITFTTEVTQVDPLPGPGLPGSRGWRVTTSDGVAGSYGHVLIANGHHGSPKIPRFEGEFTGESFHAHDYRSAQVFTGKRVLVIGVGNSGMDVACDASRMAAAVLLSTRHGVHVIPKYALGRPVDQLSPAAMAYVPFELERLSYEALVRLATGPQHRRGMPKPDHRLLGAHPTVSAELLDRVGHGDIVMKPDIDRFHGEKVQFADGTTECVDLVVYATGYNVSLPFLDPSVFDPAGNRMPLYLRIVPPTRPGLWFMGFVQTVGSGIPLTEYQAEWVGDLICGRLPMPDVAAMQRWIADDARAMAKRYLRSERHTMQVDYWRYIRTMKQARRPGGWRTRIPLLGKDRR